MAYLIFARKEFQRPLEWVGQLQDDRASAVQDDQTAESVRLLALERFGDTDWIEMIAVPELALVRVIPSE